MSFSLVPPNLFIIQFPIVAVIKPDSELFAHFMEFFSYQEQGSQSGADPGGGHRGQMTPLQNER